MTYAPEEAVLERKLNEPELPPERGIVEKAIRWAIIATVILSILFLAYIVIAFLFPPIREALRDIAIFILAVFQIIATVIIIVLLMAVLYAVKAMNDLTSKTIRPAIEQISLKVNDISARTEKILENAGTITGNVRNASDTVTTTTTFVAEQIVSPVIRISSLMTGVRVAAHRLARRDVQEAHAEEQSGVEPASVSSKNC